MRALTTPRLTGRLPRPEDATALAAIYRTADAAHWLSAGKLPADRELAEMVAGDLACWREHGLGRWYWVEHATGELVARCGPAPATIDGVQEIELHWSVRPDRQRRGLATEAAAAATDAALTMLDSVVAFAHVDNAASQAVARRVGFTREREFDFRGQPCVLFRRYSSAITARNAASSGSSIE